MKEKESPPDAVRFLLSRTTVDPGKSRRKGIANLRFQIKHIMYLTMWTAVILSVREPLTRSFPEIAKQVIWVSGIAAGLLVVSLYGIALMMEEGATKDKLVRRLLYVLTADMLVCLIFSLLGRHH